MSVTPGSRLGPYEVVCAIGAGGMGQVYRATDTKLKRQVAIKVLPPSLAADHDRLARFQREAEVLGGQRFLIGTANTDAKATATVVLNWMAGLKKSLAIGFRS